MNTILLLACAAATAPLETGTLLSYQGEIVARRGEDIRMEIQYQVLAAGTGEKGTRLLWVVAEKGQGGWPWVEQFGAMEVDPRGRVVAGKPPSVLLSHADGVSPVPLPMPVLAGPDDFAKGVKWREGRLEHEVQTPDDKNVAGKAWRIKVTSPIGRKRTVHVEKERSVVTDVDEIVFVGPGKEHRMTLVLTEQKPLDADAMTQTLATFKSLAALHESLELKPDGGKVNWSEAQLAKLKEELPAIIEQAAGTPLADLTMRAAGDAKLQKGIAAALDKLREEHIGQAAPTLDFPSASLSGKALKSADIKGKPLVLHLWSYRDTPLVEPYGQTGYLDFLHRRHKDDGVAVFGVAVDDRLDRPDTRSDAVRSVRKLQSFMNLGYPIVLGGSAALEKFGDPTQFGAELPLVIVIDAEGKITHYHAGLYEVDRDRGLAELDAAVEKLK